MDLTSVFMEIVLNPRMQDEDLESIKMSKKMNTEVFFKEYDKNSGQLCCDVRFSSAYRMEDYLHHRREWISKVLNTLPSFKTTIINLPVCEHRLPCGRYQQYVELEVVYSQLI